MPGKAKARKGGKKKKASRKAAADGAADGPDAAGLGRAGRQESAEDARKRNPKAFVFASRGKAKVQKLRRAEREQRRLHVPTVERAPAEPPPFVVLVQGPPGVGKTTLIKCMVKHYTRQNINEPRGPITVIAGKARRLTFIECPQDLHGMVDASKYADLVLLLVDAAFGFEMETFEFLNLLQVQGFPKVMGVLTHLDGFKDAAKLKKAKKTLKHRFWAEVYQGAKLFYLSGLRNGRYLKREILNLARFIAVMKFRPLAWRQAHPFLLADRFEDVTPEERVQADALCDRSVALFGYARGTAIKPGARVHLAGVGDFTVEEMDALPDPCPLPGTLKKRGLNEKERLLHAPMADVGGLLYDKDAVYISLPDWKVNFSGAKPAQTEGEAMVQTLAAGGHEVDRKLDAARIQLFSSADPIAGADAGRQPPGGSLAAEDESDLEEEAGGAAEPRGPDTRVRRRAFFDEEAGEPLSGGESSEEEDEEAAEGEEEREEASGSESDDSEGLGHAARWKRNLLAGAGARAGGRQPDLQALVYGAGADEEPGGSESDSDGDLFRPRGRADAAPAAGDVDAADAPDCSRLPEDAERLRVWEDAEAREGLRDRFVTGDWEQGAARDAAEPALDASDSDGEVFGDFEDMETGERFGADGDAATAAALRAIADERRARSSEKAAKKAAFDSEYDVGGSKAIQDRPAGGAAPAEGGEGEEEETFYDAMKQEMAAKALRTTAALDALDPQQRLAMEGHRPGTYLRLCLRGVPCELVRHFSPAQPLLLGGLSSTEEARGYLQLRLKRHRWFPKLLKTRDPLTFSVGWRRFQSVPVYAIEDANGRHRMLKYTPEHMHCLANIYGALAPTGTGVVAIQSAAPNQKGWRISATGVVTGLDAAPRVVKKLKLTGAPTRILKNTAFIGGMFNSPLEVAKFEGASIRTVSGVRGTIKKACAPGKQGKEAGAFRATFEDRLLMSDIVFLRAWIAVDLPRFYNPVTNLLGPAPARAAPAQAQPAAGVASEASGGGSVPASLEAAFVPSASFAGARAGYHFTTGPLGTGYYSEAGGAAAAAAAAAEAPQAAEGGEAAGGEGWVGMRTVAQLRREAGVGPPRNPDSLYRPIERAPRNFNPLKIPRSLQADLPYKSKPKNMAERKRKSLEQRRAVVLEPGEKKAVSLVQQLNALRNAKELKRRAAAKRKREEHAKKVAETEAWRAKLSKEERKKRAIQAGLAEKFRGKRARRE